MNATRFSQAVPAALAGALLSMTARAGFAQVQETGSQPATQPATSPGPRTTPVNVDWMLRLMHEQMVLSADQWDKIDAKVRAHEQELTNRRKARNAAYKQHRKEIRALTRQLADTLRTGDTDKRNEIRAKLDELRPSYNDHELESSLIRDIATVLNEKDQQTFQTIVTEARKAIFSRQNLRRNPQYFRKVVIELGLSQPQQAHFDKLYQAWIQRATESMHADQATKDQVDGEFFCGVMELLSEMQRARFDEEIADFGCGVSPPQ